jgi:PAS domain S-box-containing protein
MSQFVEKGNSVKKDTGRPELAEGSHLWVTACLFAGTAILYFADIILYASGISAPAWQQYYIDRGLYLIVFSVPLLYCSYIYRVRGVIVSALILAALFALRIIYTFPDMLPFYKSVVFTCFLVVLGLLIARYQNIHDREKQDLETIKASEKRYKALTENLADVVWTMDMNLHYTYVNPAVTRVRGYTVQEAMAQSIEDLLAPESVETARKALAEELSAENTGSAPYRTRVLYLVEKHKDGTTVPVEIKVIFLRDSSGKATEILGVTREITK